MEDHPQPANVAEQEVQIEEEPPLLVNVADQQPQGNVQPLPDPDHELLLPPDLLLDVENDDLLDVDDIAELMHPDGELPLEFDDIERLLDEIDFFADEEEEEAYEENATESNENPGHHDHDDSDDEPDFEALAAIISKSE